jgi:hypothetical protein
LQPRLSLVTLGVEDLERAARFYEQVLELPRLPSPPSVAFFELGRTWLSLYSREALAEDAEIPAEGSGFRGFTLAHNVGSPEEVDTLLRQVAERGGRIVKPARRADWGGHSGYFADPDGFLWEVAWNPDFPHLD